jgi:hypothetical protein
MLVGMVIVFALVVFALVVFALFVSVLAALATTRKGAALASVTSADTTALASVTSADTTSGVVLICGAAVAKSSSVRGRQAEATA